MKDYYNILLENKKIISKLYEVMNLRLDKFYKDQVKNPDPNLISDKFFCQILNEAILKESIFKNYSFAIRPKGITLRNNDQKFEDSLIIDRISFCFFKDDNQYKISSIAFKKLLNKKDQEIVSIIFDFNDNNTLEKFTFYLDNNSKSYLSKIAFSNNVNGLINIEASEYNINQLSNNDLWKNSKAISNMTLISNIKEKEILKEINIHLFNLFIENTPIPKEKIDFLSIMCDLDLSSLNQLNNYFIDANKIDLDCLINTVNKNKKGFNI